MMNLTKQDEGSELYDPQIAPIRAHLNPLRNLTMSRVVNLLELAQRGYYADLTWLYAHVEKREHVMKALVERRQSALGSCVWRVELTEEATKDESVQEEAVAQQEFIHGIFSGIDNLRDAWKWLGTASFRGYAHLEKHYDASGNVKHLEPVPQWFWCQNFPSLKWQFNPDAMNTSRGIEVEGEHFVCREVTSSLDELAVFDWIRKSLAMRDWSTYVGTFGVPNIFLKATDRNNMPSPNEMAAWRATLERYVSNGRGVLPVGVEAQMFGGGSSDSTPFPGFTDYIDKMLVLAGTGGKLTMLSEATGIGSGATGAHEDAFEDIAADEGGQIADILDAAIAKPRLDEAFPGMPHYVRFVIKRNEKQDQKEGADILGALKSAGWRVNEEEAEKLVGLDLEHDKGSSQQSNAVEPEEGEEPTEGTAMNRKRDANDPLERDLEDVARLALGDCGEAMRYLTEVLGIENEDERRVSLQSFIEKLPAMLQSANVEPKSAEIIEKLLVDGFTEGLQVESKK